MLALVGTLILSYLKLDVGPVQKPVLVKKWAVDIPFSVYLGWVSVATISQYHFLVVTVSTGTGSGLPRQVWAVNHAGGCQRSGCADGILPAGCGILCSCSSGPLAGIAVKAGGEPLVAKQRLGSDHLALGLAVYSLVQRRRTNFNLRFNQHIN